MRAGPGNWDLLSDRLGVNSGMSTQAVPIPIPKTEMLPRPRRRIPISLQIFGAILLLLGTVSAISFGVPAYKQQVAIQGIERAGGSVVTSFRGPLWVRRWIGDSWIRPFESIDRADIVFSETLDADLKHFPEIRPLPELYIEGGPPVHDFLRKGLFDEAKAAFKKDPILLFSRDADNNYFTPLQTAVRSGQVGLRQRVEMVRFLLERGLDVDAAATWSDNPTPLLRAKDPEIVKLLIDHGANLATPGPNSEALEKSSRKFAESSAEDRDKWLEITRLLRAAGAEYGVVSACYLNDIARVRHLAAARGRAPCEDEALCVAAKHGHAEIVKVLLEYGGDPDAPGVDRFSPLFCAIEHPDVLKILLDAVTDHGRPRVGYRGQTLLHSAASHGAVESARLVLAYGISVESRNRDGRTPLHDAAEWGEVDVVKLLLDRNADPMAVDDEGWTPLSLAMSEIDWHGSGKGPPRRASSRMVAELLLAAGTPIDLFAAISLDQMSAVSRILAESPEMVNRGDWQGITALERAFNWDRVDCVAALLEAGADVNAVDALGVSVLNKAAYQGHYDIVRILIAHHADVNLADRERNTPLHEAASGHNPTVIRLLFDAGATPDAENDYGQTPLDLARRRALLAKSESERLKWAETIELLRERERQ